jgi:hypothetical protein
VRAPFSQSTPAACPLQHNKKREELHRLQAKHPEVAARLERQLARSNAQDVEDGDEDEESSTSEEEASCGIVQLFSYKGAGPAAAA